MRCRWRKNRTTSRLSKVQAQKGVQAGDDAQKADHSQLAKRVEEMTAGRLHMIAAVTDAFHLGAQPPQGGDQVGAVQIAARLAGADK